MPSEVPMKDFEPNPSAQATPFQDYGVPDVPAHYAVEVLPTIDDVPLVRVSKSYVPSIVGESGYLVTVAGGSKL